MPFHDHARKHDTQAAILLAYAGAALAPAGAMIAADPAWGGQDALIAAGRGLGVMACSLLALQPVLAARLRSFDRAFGLDSVYVFHKTMGMIAGMLLAFGLALLGAGGGWLAHSAAIAAFGLLVMLMLTAFLYREFGMTYEGWRALHNLLAISVLFASFAEAVRLTAGAAPARVLLTLFAFAGGAAYAHHRMIGPIRRRKHPYLVESVTRETRNVWTIALRPPEGKSVLEYVPGQFQFLTFNEGRGEEHPFTISSSPSQAGVHTATIKESGDFTRTIGKVKPGDRIAVQAPFGRFSYVLHPGEKDLVFIAGGIGITPLMSMLRHMRDTKADRDVLLLYANNAEEDIVFRGELEAIAAGTAPRLRVVHVLARPDGGWRGERGFIGKALIEKYCADGIANRSFYICGPPPMMTAIITLLIGLGAPSSRVRSERFAL